ncbi:MAG TPA: DUF4166 domain-containing protein [Microvirga sp.]|nr:DUF4166 domain-containing protein [Microvirga sp.]
MTPLILVVGGTGAFGRRLVEGLLATTAARVLVGGRNPRRGADFIASLKKCYGAERIDTLRLDRDDALEVLRAVKPFCVVDAAGPFQGGEPHLARAAIIAGSHYIDLADARDFVAGFTRLNGAASDANVLVVTGASSTPALSGAALAMLTDGWQSVDDIAVAISPGNRAPRGLSVIEAILAYAGRPVRVWLDGRWTTRPGWSELIRRDMPGLGPRWLSLCETPDLDLLPLRYPSARNVCFRAGLELSLLHLGLWLLTWPVRVNLISSLRPYASFLQTIAARFERLGTDRGGMSIEASGRDREGRPVQAIWSLVAEAGDGPNIPVLPALALIRGLIDGSIRERGAKIASDLLSFERIEHEFSRFRITVRKASGWLQGSNLFEIALGPDLAHLPPAVREIHTNTPIHLSGRATISGAERWRAKILAKLFGFPDSTDDVEADILLNRLGRREIWIRRFGRSAFRSTLRPGPAPRRVYERFGPFEFELELTPDRSGFTLDIVRWYLGPIRLPKRSAPRAPARAFVDENGRYRFDVAISLPLIGRLVRYRGWLLPEER